MLNMNLYMLSQVPFTPFIHPKCYVSCEQPLNFQISIAIKQSWKLQFRKCIKNIIFLSFFPLSNPPRVYLTAKYVVNLIKFQICFMFYVNAFFCLFHHENCFHVIHRAGNISQNPVKQTKAKGRSKMLKE